MKLSDFNVTAPPAAAALYEATTARADAEFEAVISKLKPGMIPARVAQTHPGRIAWESYPVSAHPAMVRLEDRYRCAWIRAKRSIGAHRASREADIKADLGVMADLDFIKQ